MFDMINEGVAGVKQEGGDDDVLCVLPSQMTTNIIESVVNNTEVVSTVMGTVFYDYDNLVSRFDGVVLVGGQEIPVITIQDYSTLIQYVRKFYYSSQHAWGVV